VRCVGRWHHRHSFNNAHTHTHTHTHTHNGGDDDQQKAQARFVSVFPSHPTLILNQPSRRPSFLHPPFPRRRRFGDRDAGDGIGRV
jgi:hypothetical protein